MRKAVWGNASFWHGDVSRPWCFTRWMDALALATLSVTALRYLHPLEQYVDLTLQDEDGYLWVGKQIGNPIHWLTSSNVSGQGPLYSIWYFFLSGVWPDSIDLFYNNCRLITIVLSILVYAAMRMRRVPALPAFLSSFLILVCYGNLGVWPKVNHFCAAIFLVSAVCASLPMRLFYRFFIGTAGSLVCSYIHPEFFLSFLLLGGVCILVTIYHPHDRKGMQMVTLFTGMLLAFLCIGFMGVPISGERGLTAFGQHFSLNWIRWTGTKDLSPWLDWKRIIQENFGQAEGLGQVIIADPVLFLKHITTNVVEIPSTLIHLLLGPGNIMEWKRLVRPETLCLVLMVAYVVYRWRGSLLRIKTNMANQIDLMLLAMVYLTPSLIASMVVFPREHYLFFPGLLLLLLSVVLFATESDRLDQKLSPMLLLCCGLALVFAPTCQSLWPEKSALPNVKTIRLIRSFPIEQEVHLLSQNRFTLHLGTNYHHVHIAEKEGTFFDFLQRRKVNMVVITDRLINHPAFREDPEWIRFHDNPDASGFNQLEIQGTGRRLCISRELLQ